MIYHIVVGDFAAEPLREAVAATPSLEGEVVVMKDLLHIGPLQKAEGQHFSALRSVWWQHVAPAEKTPIVVGDMERLLEVSNELYKNPEAQAWCWMAPWPADVTAYYWMLPYLSKHAGRFYIVNIANLPFLDAAGKVFYPKNISEILPRELIKASRLARPVTPAEVEMDGEEWKKMVAQNAGIRTHEGGKKLAAQEAGFYDAILLNYCTSQFSKASRVLQQAMSRHIMPTGDLHLAWRLRQMAEQGLLALRGDITKSYRDWDVKLAGESAETP